MAYGIGQSEGWSVIKSIPILLRLTPSDKLPLVIAVELVQCCKFRVYFPELLGLYRPRFARLRLSDSLVRPGREVDYSGGPAPPRRQLRIYSEPVEVPVPTLAPPADLPSATGLEGLKLR